MIDSCYYYLALVLVILSMAAWLTIESFNPASAIYMPPDLCEASGQCARITFFTPAIGLIVLFVWLLE